MHLYLCFKCKGNSPVSSLKKRRISFPVLGKSKLLGGKVGFLVENIKVVTIKVDTFQA